MWWPLVIWSRKFKIEDVASGPLETTVVQRLFGASRLPNAISALTRLAGRLRKSKTRLKRARLQSRLRRSVQACAEGSAQRPLGGDFRCRRIWSILPCPSAGECRPAGMASHFPVHRGDISACALHADNKFVVDDSCGSLDWPQSQSFPDIFNPSFNLRLRSRRP